MAQPLGIHRYHGRVGHRHVRYLVRLDHDLPEAREVRAHRRLRVVIAMFLYAAMPMLAGLSGFWLVLTMLDQVALAIGVGLLGGFAAGLGLWALIIPHSGLTTPGEASDIVSGAP
jgi:hypothetical protein